MQSNEVPNYLSVISSWLVGITTFSLSANDTRAVQRTSLLRQTAMNEGWSIIHSIL